MAQSSQRYNINPTDPLRTVKDPREELQMSLALLVEGCPPVDPWPSPVLNGEDKGLFTGPTSVAILFFYLSRSHPKLDVSGRSPSDWCDQYLACAMKGLEKSSAPPLEHGCGITHPSLAFHAVSAAFSDNMADVSALQDAFSAARIDPKACEWMGGRAGALYLLRFVRTFVPSSVEVVNGIIERLIEQILAAKPWSWRGKDYIGAVHGDIGIITQVILSDPAYASTLEEDLAKLLDMQQEDGNWPLRPGQGGNLVQFCHGAPGFVFSLLALRPHFPNLQTQIDKAVERARQCIWKEGFLIKEPCLCHGASGNALALDYPEKEHMLALTTFIEIRTGLKNGTFDEGKRDPWGLLWGEAGRAWSWAVLDSERSGSGMLRGILGYTDA